MKIEEILNTLERVTLPGNPQSYLYTSESVVILVRRLLTKINKLKKENSRFQDMKKTLETPIAELIDPLTNEKTSLKLVNKLYLRAEYSTLGDIIKLGRNSISMIPTIGPTSMKELDRIMKSYGYKQY